MQNNTLNIQPRELEKLTSTDGELTPNKTTTGEKKHTLEDEVGVSLDDIEISANLAFRIAKDALPDNVKIGKDPKLALGKSSTVFISYLGAIAQELAAEKNHKLVAVDDVLNALKMIEFPEFIEPLKEYLEATKEAARAKKQNMAEADAEAKNNNPEDSNAMQD